MDLERERLVVMDLERDKKKDRDWGLVVYREREGMEVRGDKESGCVLAL